MLLRKTKNIALFIDGPNMIRKEFSFGLEDIVKKAKKYGRIVIGKVFLNQFAPEKLIEAVANHGLEPIITLGEKNATDVDVALAVHAMEAVHDPKIDIIVIATRDADFTPLLQKIKEHGKLAVLIAAKEALGTSLKKSADKVELLK
ncbi:MAG TPA: NYN domain-containing protein [Nanoarchaeota archaeon]|nr:NYN domain-containing protein [Nanoarchaeota archaeon]